MHCVLVEPHLAAYVDGELESATRAEVERHLQTCRSCREAERDMRLASAVLAQWRPVRPTTRIAEIVTRRIREENVRPEAPREKPEPVGGPVVPSGHAWRTRWHYLGFAAVLVAAFAAWVVIGWFGGTGGRFAASRMAALGQSAAQVEDAADLRASALVVDAHLGQAWSARRPDVAAIVQLEVAETLIRSAGDARGTRDVSEMLKELGAAGVSRGSGGSGMPSLALTAKEWLCAALFAARAYADEPSRDLAPLLEEATRLEESGDLDGAAEKYRQAAEDRVLTLRASIMQANVEMKRGRAGQAVLALDRAFALTKPETFYREVVTELRERAQKAVDLRKRIDDLQSKLLETERDFDLLSDIGGLQVRSGDLMGAEETFGRMAQSDEKGREKDVLRARLVRAWCRRGLNRAQEAFEEFDRLVVDAREASPEVSMLAQFERAKTLQMNGRPAQALDDYRALAATPSALGPAAFAAVQFQIGYLLLTVLDLPAEAADAFRTLQARDLKGQPFARLARTVANDVSPVPE